MTGQQVTLDPDEPDSDVVVDAGLAAERTFLAWQRTAIGVVAGSGVATHYVAPAMGGVIPIIIGITGVVLGLGALIWMRLRYRRSHHLLKTHGTFGPRGALPLAMVAVSVVALAILVALMPVLAYF